jgi:hypothetical protein
MPIVTDCPTGITDIRECRRSNADRPTTASGRWRPGWSSARQPKYRARIHRFCSLSNMNSVHRTRGDSCKQTIRFTFSDDAGWCRNWSPISTGFCQQHNDEDGLAPGISARRVPDSVGRASRARRSWLVRDVMKSTLVADAWIRSEMAQVPMQSRFDFIFAPNAAIFPGVAVCLYKAIEELLGRRGERRAILRMKLTCPQPSPVIGSKRRLVPSLCAS